MRLIRYLNPELDDRPACSVAVGNFDGLHRGHQALLDAACAGGGKLATAMMCFEPLPATFFRPQAPVPRLLNLRDRVGLARDYGLDLMFMLRFNVGFARQSPERFVRDVLVRGANARRVVVGHDFRFGSRAAGDVTMLMKLARRYDFELVCVDAVDDGDERISSSRVREALAVGKLDVAAGLLGRPYAISGRVLRGNELGRQLGFATVNLRPPIPPALHGVYSVRVSGAGLDHHPGVASIGLRPTVDGRDWLLEAHLFDYDGDLYGRHVRVEFVEFIRAERKFEDVDAMKRQMIKDAEKARETLDPARS
ncbi:bifunctional riboflavin kinase/FAD synthetase [Wenzhouxiangella sp. AB-CW3]|uniref:bifunctional riboflavin kinase/FAD synthetase n=1 Tax=Wenzhouxiangella sp. AB-CW3 TaxID=2771012 RepID=UPI00168BE284|nr:bifunctional riboflavin kinase/FAD synthetase [Wenzhouxiangella sp. AB-CW3]QOC23625.1 bifunctional riboflavin kinase/FAD synthetase [Wenzhouxiangella sp. AB-CW3]